MIITTIGRRGALLYVRAARALDLIASLARATGPVIEDRVSRVWADHREHPGDRFAQLLRRTLEEAGAAAEHFRDGP